jgi:hypothetical protein
MRPNPAVERTASKQRLQRPAAVTFNFSESLLFQSAMVPIGHETARNNAESRQLSEMKMQG